MPKKVNRSKPVQNVKPGADPYQKNKAGNNLGKLIGAVVLLIFICFEQLWIGTAACALAFAALCAIQVFAERSKTLFTSTYFYAALVTAVLAYAEYSSGLISNLLKLG